ncbi:chemotaxis protein CheB [Amycolatopsis nalaikhensis]|uniref:protein-glutamate methylesterase n=1 Tax=Amycolatopsis nalaikhensis TaxID=715472 RepID=A0ABY8XTY8_9PSEU|nr:chemotaxis protein CheB [Amycolatopsis sp. 2-2]WIV59154.1 chemotaxis protein CheB [Amycolatopsis sp. 2-2]
MATIRWHGSFPSSHWSLRSAAWTLSPTCSPPLPADLPAAVVIAQHLAPDRASHLTEILAKRTALRVREARNDDELTPGTVLLATLAVTCGSRALAVVLTGHGRDAQAGIRAIRHCGGTVFAQDHATSADFGMPGAAIATGLVDDVLSLPDIAAAIRAHVERHVDGSTEDC